MKRLSTGFAVLTLIFGGLLMAQSELPPGGSTGGGGEGRSGTMLYQWVGRSASGRMILVAMSGHYAPAGSDAA